FSLSCQTSPPFNLLEHTPQKQARRESILDRERLCCRITPTLSGWPLVVLFKTPRCVKGSTLPSPAHEGPKMSTTIAALGQSARPQAALVFVNGAEQRKIALDHVPFTIGRNDDKDLVIADGRVSRDHAAIQDEGLDYVILERGGNQGTYVNRVEIERHKLNNNVLIEFGVKGGPYLIFNPTSTEQLHVGRALTAISRVSIFSKLSPSDIEL